MKQKVKSVPKELVRRGLDDGTKRLRGQLRDTAQRGQADDYGGDRIEDTAVGTVQRTGHGMESLLKMRKKGKGREPDGEPFSLAEPSTPQEPPAEPSSQDPPQIKTRDATVTRESGVVPTDGGRAESIPVAGFERQRIKIRDRDTPADTPLTPRDRAQPPRIKVRESAAHDPPVSGESAPQAQPERPQIRTGNAVTGTPTPVNEKRPPVELLIKTKDAYIQQHPTAAPDQPSQAFVQGQRGFIQKQSQRAAMKRSEAQRTGNSVLRPASPAQTHNYETVYAPDG